MNIAETFIRRPVGSFLMAVALLLLGILAYRLTPIAPLPAVDIPTIVVNANLPGASPESISATVATPLERAMNGISGVKAINASSSQGSSQIELNFELDRDIHDAAREVQAALNAASAQLPAGMPEPPSYRKVNPSQAPIMIMALSSKNLSASQLYDAASNLLSQRISQIEGVGTVDVGGASMPAIRVTINPQALAHQGVSLEQVRQAIVSSNSIRPLGVVEQAAYRWQINLNAGLQTATDFSNVIVQETPGSIIRLKDVAEVRDSVENRYSAGFHNNEPAVVVRVRRQPNANIAATVDAINRQMPYLQALMPADSTLSVVMDRSRGIRAALYESQVTLMIAALLVVLVICLFLGRWRSAVIPAVVIPVSIIGAFSFIYLFGFSLNNLSVMALIIATGLVVDDAIVVLENIERHIEAGLKPVQAALQGAREVGFTLIAMNVALMVIFISILFMGGVIERLFREFSLTLVMVMALSLLLSLTLTPSLCAYCLKSSQYYHDKDRQSWLSRTSQNIQQGLLAIYARTLGWTLKHGYVVLVLWFAVIAGSVYLYKTLPHGVLPEQDTGRLEGFVRGDDGFSFQIMQPKIEAYRQYLLQDPAVQDLIATAGGDEGTTNADISITLKPMAERQASAQEIANRLRANAPHIPGGVLMTDTQQDIYLQNPFAGSNNEYRLLLQADELPILRKWAPIVAKGMEGLPQLTEVETIGDEGAQQVVLHIDREAAQRLGVNMQAIASVLNNSFSQRQISTIYQQNNQYRVVMEVDTRFTEQPSSLANVQVMTSIGQRVPLSSFATWRYGIVNDRVHRRNQYAALGIEYALAPGYSAAQAEHAIRNMLSGLMLPSDVFVATDRDIETENLQSSVSTPLLLLGVMLVVYLVLGVLYESLIHPLTILSTLPSAMGGALLALWMTKTEFSLIALLGLFLLIGIVMKNAIMMVDFAIAAQRQTLSAHAAILQAAQLRLRPILMTNIATFLGAIPLAIGFGEGAEFRQPLGITIAGGVLLSQFLTLYTTPVIYLYFARLQHWLKRKNLKQSVDADGLTSS
jgi:multidrug efflux pump